MPAHQRKQPAIARSARIELPPNCQEMVLYQADYMEPISHDQGTEKVLSHERAVA